MSLRKLLICLCSCRLKRQLSEIESGGESSVMESIEKNSARQQQAIRQVRLCRNSQESRDLIFVWFHNSVFVVLFWLEEDCKLFVPRLELLVK